MNWPMKTCWESDKSSERAPVFNQFLPGLVGEVVRHHAVTGLKQWAADNATLALGPLLPLRILLTRVSHYLGGVTEVRVLLPTICKGRDIDSLEATLGHEVVSLVSVKVTTETFHLVRISKISNQSNDILMCMQVLISYQVNDIKWKQILCTNFIHMQKKKSP